MTAPAEGATGEIDEARMAEVLALVGPAAEQGLLRSLIGDLRAARVALIRAADQGDAALLRRQTHILTSLAGTFGAHALGLAAQELEARSLAGTAIPDPAPTLTGANRLIDLLLARLDAMPS